MTNINGIKLLHADIDFNPKDVTHALLDFGGLYLDHKPSGRSYATDTTRVMQPINDDNKNIVRVFFDENTPDKELFTESKFDLTAQDLFDKETFIELWIDGSNEYHEDGFMDVNKITLYVQSEDGKIHEIPVN